MRPRFLQSCLLAALAAPFTSAAVEPATAWDVAVADRPLVPAGKHTAVADGKGDLLVVATEARGAQACIVTAKRSGASGALLWRQEACGDASTHAVAIAADPQGNGIVAGNLDGRFHLAKYANGSGAPAWSRPYAGEGLEVAAGLAVDAHGDVFLMGRPAAAASETWIAKHRGADGTMGWQQPIDAGVEVSMVGIAVDADGNAFVAGNYTESNGDADWHLAKLAGSSGAVLWRKIHDTGAGDVAAALVVDGAGDVTVAALVGDGFTVVKHEGATGRSRWESRHAAAGARSLAAVGHDAAGAVMVAGAVNGQIRAMKLGASDGALLWEAAPAGGSGEARALAVDAAGDMILTGRSVSANGLAQLRTVKLAGADGRELWSAARTGSGGDDAGHAVVATGDATFAIGHSSAEAATGLRIIKYVEAEALPRAAALNVQGLWWQPAEPGWGVNLTQQGDVLFATWFTYDAEGQGQWLVMSEGRRTGDDSYVGTLYRTTGPAFNAMPFDAKQVAPRAVGTASFTFRDADHGTFRYTVDGVGGEKTIHRQVFGTQLPVCAIDGPEPSQPVYQDLWWAPGGSESGWGLNITHQGDILFITWFTYGGDGRGMWLVGSNVARTGNATFRGTLYRTHGPPLSAQPWNPAQVGVAAAGHATLTFADADRGTFAYTLDGVTQAKEITRQVFAAPVTVCR